jgi:hypothetical protein
MSAVASALPAFVATMFAVCMYVGYLPTWTAAILAVLGGAATLIGRSLLSSRPIAGTYLFAPWILVGIGLIAYAGCGSLWLALHTEYLLPVSDEATVKEVGAAIGASVTTFLGIVLTKDFGDGQGAFWPGGCYRKQIQRVFGQDPLKPPRSTQAFEAVWADRVHGGPNGWGYKARLERAKILNEHLKTIPKKTAPVLPPDRPAKSE